MYDSMYHGLCYTSCGALAGPRNSSTGASLMTGRKGNVLFNNALNIFYFMVIWHRTYGKGHSDSDRENLLPSHGLLFPISSKGSFICTIPQTG